MLTFSKLICNAIANMNISLPFKMILLGVCSDEVNKNSSEKIKKQISIEPSSRVNYDDIAKKVEYWFGCIDNLKYDCSIDDLAISFNVSNRILHNYFQVILKKDFRTYKIEKRILRAKEILIEEDYIKISKVAEILGFKDKSNFHRQFKKIVGCSPCKWRDSSGHPEIA